MVPFEFYNQLPTASFTYSPENPVVNQTITFDASSSYDPDGQIVSYEWDFGDGTNGTEEIVNHSYSSPGNYTVNLTVTDDDSVMNSTNKTIIVYPPAAGFDTGTPANQYPSIMGNHTGTIKPNHTVIATKLYTYPCEGTGGHTEYAEIRNATWNATATWKGYVGDLHNITFDKTVVLLANETYNYTIKTGSYPQIHHTDRLEMDDGVITCDTFIDANGKRYID
jgi:PKD repeat protein